MNSEKEPLLSGKNRLVLKEPISMNNPITIQILGICSALAITSQLRPSVVMGVAVVVVMTVSSVVISLLRSFIPARIRIIVEMTVVASMVILVDQVLKAYAYQVSKELSIFVGLIITNCIVLGRLEAYALSNRAWPSFLDALGTPWSSFLWVFSGKPWVRVRCGGSQSSRSFCMTRGMWTTDSWCWRRGRSSYWG